MNGMKINPSSAAPRQDEYHRDDLSFSLQFFPFFFRWASFFSLGIHRINLRSCRDGRKFYLSIRKERLTKAPFC